MNEVKQTPIVKNDEEISLKDLIYKGGQWYRYVLSKWLIIVIAGVLGAGIGLIVALRQKPRYKAILTFVLEEGKSSALSSYSSIASQFGVDLGGGGSNGGLFASDNIKDYLTSRLIVEKALLAPVEVDGKKETLVEMYMDFMHMKGKQSKDTVLRNLHYPLGADRKTFTRVQDSVLFSIAQRVVKGELEIEKGEAKTSGFVTVFCLSENEIFAKAFVIQLVNEATSFYIGIKTKRSQHTVDNLQAKADSIEQLLNRKTYTYAMEQDVNLNPVRKVATVNSEMVSRDKVVLQTMFSEVVKNLELSKMAMAQETPVIQIIDAPILPLMVQKLGITKGIVIGGIVAGFLCVFALTGIRIYREIMQ